MSRYRTSLGVLTIALVLAVAVGVLGRGYWTPDEPREADIAWRMSWQADRAVPLLAGEAFCEKPPLTYWVAGAAMRAWGSDAWVARLPNLLYAAITALAVGAIARRNAGSVAAAAAATAITTFLLSYQVAIWLATDAPLLASVAVALLGLSRGFHAEGTGERLSGYGVMHAAMAFGFLSKSAAAWMVPASTLITLVIWERRWRELLRWELYAGLVLQAVLILSWVAAVRAGPDGAAHLRVFFWNNLVGRFAKVDAPADLQYASGHRNSPGKYLIELPLYLAPWTLLVIAAARRAWVQRHDAGERMRCVRFGIAAFVPTLGVLSVAATARNIYLAPALPGIALLLAWWVQQLPAVHDRWDARALRGTVVLLAAATGLIALATVIVGRDAWQLLAAHPSYVGWSVFGLGIAAASAIASWRAVHTGRWLRATLGLALGYCALLSGPASQIYRGVDTWQNLASVGEAIRRDAAGRPLILVAPDETTRAFIDMTAASSVGLVPGPLAAAAVEELRHRLTARPRSLVVVQLPGHRAPTWRELAAALGIGEPAARVADDAPRTPAWAAQAGLRIAHLYALPNGRRYAALEPIPAATAQDAI